MNNFRIGYGYDSHRFEPGRRLVLGGVEFPGETGLRGHSDADALLHAVIDALLGAAGMDDIGARYPDTDPRWKDADSAALLADAARALPASSASTRTRFRSRGRLTRVWTPSAQESASPAMQLRF